MITEIVLCLVIIVLLIERYLHMRDYNKQINDLNKVIASRTSTDYLTYRIPDQKGDEEKKEEMDEIPVESISDDEFFRAIVK